MSAARGKEPGERLTVYVQAGAVTQAQRKRLRKKARYLARRYADAAFTGALMQASYDEALHDLDPRALSAHLRAWKGATPSPDVPATEAPTVAP